MASSGSADEDFQSRVAKIFGSLAFSRSTSSNTSTSSAPSSRQNQSGSVWSLSDTEVEKREWKREQLASYDRDELPCASSFDELLRRRISSTAPDAGEEGANEDIDDEWSIRASMGLDPTLDDEEEEDEYDKVALGKEDSCEGLPMIDALSKSPGCRIRDPRANLVAAKLRLKEDEIEANKFSPSDDHSSKSKEQKSQESSKAVQPKPILKRKENSSDSETKTSKRVRFDVVSEETSKKPEDTCLTPASSLKSALHQGKSGASVPDYLINPSKYTCYTFDPSCELDGKSQTQEHMDISNKAEGLETSDSESFEKVSFIPQKKTKDVREDSSNCSETKPIVAGQVAEDERPIATEDGDEDNEIGESESCNSFQRNGRQYRARQSLDETDV